MLEKSDADDKPAGDLSPTFLTDVRFEDFDLPEEVRSGLKDAGFTRCTPIQAKVLPVSLGGKDVAGQAQTGTGKTAAFLVTLFTTLLRKGQQERKGPRGLILAPTRELAVQVYEEARVLGGHTGFRLALAIGGIGYREQAEDIRKGTDIIICTPGRIIDYMKQGVFKPGWVESLVIDEADRLFDLGFIKDLRYLLGRLPHYENRQSMLFSATLSYRVLELTYEFMNLPEVISVTPEEITVEGIDQRLYHVGSDEKLSLLLGILGQESWTRILIFLNTKSGVEWLAAKLKGNGLPAEGISGDLPQKSRLKLMQQFKDGRLKILVATDVASRGIHVEDISHVINYDLPQDPENYVHRIGRTARAGKTGKAISFACEQYVFHLEPIEKILGDKIPVAWAEDGFFKKDQAGDIRPSRRRRPEREPRQREAPERPPRVRAPRGRPKEEKETLRVPEEEAPVIPAPPKAPVLVPPQEPEAPEEIEAMEALEALEIPPEPAPAPEVRVPLPTSPVGVRINLFGIAVPILHAVAQGPVEEQGEKKRKRRPRRGKRGAPESHPQEAEA